MTSTMQDLLDKVEDLHEDLEPYLEKSSSLGQILRHPLLYSVPYHPTMNAYLNKAYEMRVVEVQRCLEIGDWSRYIFWHERPHRFAKFTEVSEQMTDLEYWEILANVWTDSENIHQYKHVIKFLFNSHRVCKQALMADDEREFLNSLPDIITIYRGHQKVNKLEMSWTLNYWKAHWFSARFGRTAFVHKANVQKKDIHAVFLGRGEWEIVVDPSHLANVKSVSNFRDVRRPDWMSKVATMAEDAFKLGAQSHHGPSHWRGVEANAIALATKDKRVDRAVVQLFAILHDCKREKEQNDPMHGERAAAFASDLHNRGLLILDDEQIGLLTTACRFHNSGTTTTDLTIGACWDADRMELPRVGIMPDLKLFSTEVGKKMLWNI